MSVFHEQALFMTATGQQPSPSLYVDLINEEINETFEAWDDYRAAPSHETLAQLADGIMDSIYVLSGLANCLFGPEVAIRLWNEVQASNMSKVQAIETADGIEYVVTRRDDGKILKPASYFKPNLLAIIKDAAG